MNDNPDDLTERITRGIQDGIDRACRIHHALGIPMVVWRDGRILHVDPMTGEPIEWPQVVRDQGPTPLPPKP